MIEAIGAVGPGTTTHAVPAPVQAPQVRAERPPEHVVASTIAAMVAPPQLARRPEPAPAPPAVRAVDLGAAARAGRPAPLQGRRDPAAQLMAEQAYARTLREALLLAVAADR